jgi:hypothetical protein
MNRSQSIVGFLSADAYANHQVRTQRARKFSHLINALEDAWRAALSPERDNCWFGQKTSFDSAA